MEDAHQISIGIPFTEAKWTEILGCVETRYEELNVRKQQKTKVLSDKYYEARMKDEDEIIQTIKRVLNGSQSK
jgi:hypothetical protein